MTVHKARNILYGLFGRGGAAAAEEAAPQDKRAGPPAHAAPENPKEGYFRKMADAGHTMALPGSVGFDPARATAFAPYARAEAERIWQPPFDPKANAADAMLEDARATLHARLLLLRQEETKLAGIERQLHLEMSAPERRPWPSPFVPVTAVMVVGASLAVSLFPMFSSIEDSLSAWVLALGIGCVTAGVAIGSLYHD